MDYYESYQLDIFNYELSDNDKLLLDACIWLVENRASIRGVARNFNMSKTYLHKHIHLRLRRLSFELYECVKRQLKINKLHRKSGLKA